MGASSQNETRTLSRIETKTLAFARATRQFCLVNKATLQTCFSGAWGGLEMVAFEVALKMKANGLEITTACTPGSPLELKLKEVGLPTLAIQRKNKYFCPKTIRTLRRALKSGRFSAVLVEQMNELWQVVPAMWGLKDIRLVGISHTLVGVTKRDLLHRWLYGRVNHLVALTEIHKRNLLAQLPVKETAVAVIPNAVDLQKFTPQRRDEALRLSFLQNPNELLLGVVSRIDKGKGLLEVIDAASKLKLDEIPFRMIIVGKETIGEEGTLAVLEAEIKRLGLENEVLLIGHRADIDTIMASIDVLVMPSPSETFGRVLIEAMASGAAVIASAGGGVPDIIRDGEDGLLVPPLDAEGLADAMIRISRNQELRQRLAENGLRAARDRYDQSKLDQKLYGILGLKTGLETGLQINLESPV